MDSQGTSHGNDVQQVMIAQTAATAQATGSSVMTNGTTIAGPGGEGANPPQTGSQYGSSGDPVGSYGSVQRAESVFVGSVEAADIRNTRQGHGTVMGGVADSSFRGLASGAELGAEQRGGQNPPLVGQSMADEAQLGFEHTRRQDLMGSPSPVRAGRRVLSSWTTGLETAPQGFGWMTRLGEFLRNRSDLWPSPFPSPDQDTAALGAVTTGRPATPPRTMPLQGLLGANLFSNNPPSSSSGIPSEVIQEEVQRQLRGVLERLDLSESRNRHLELQLEAYRQERELAAAAAERQRAEQQRAEQQRAVLESSSQAVLSEGPAELPEVIGTAGIRRQAKSSLGVPPAEVAGLQRSGHAQGDSGVQPTPKPGIFQGLLNHVRERNPLRDSLGIGAPQGNTSGTLAQETSMREDAAYPQYLESRERPLRDSPSIEVPKGNISGSSSALPAQGNRPREQAEPSLLDALSRSVQQLQSLQEQALNRGVGSPTAQENVKPGSATLQSLPAPKDETSSLLFQDWLEIATIAMSDLSDSSAEWWAQLLDAVNEAYGKFLAATPIERLSIRPSSGGLTSGKWVRVNARACSMLLAAVDEVTKQDLIARRISQDMVQSVFRLFVIYQPGGSAEKTHVLKQLQNPSAPANLQECLGVLRCWPRWLRRCRQVGMLVPDPSVLASSLTRITSPYLAQYPDSNFRTQLLRTTLRIEASPTVEAVESYHNHLLAELEVIMSSGSANRTKPQLNALEGQASPTSSGSPAKSNKAEAQCKYFAKSSGCRRGAKCPYLHDAAQLPKDLRARKCLLCGSEAHRKRDCPTNENGAKGSGKRDEGSAKGGPGKPGAASGPSGYQQTQLPQPSLVTAAQVEVPSAESPKAIMDTSAEVVQGQPMSIENLIRAAQQIVQGHSGGSPGRTTSDAASLKVMSLQNPVHGWGGEVVSATALVDTGATHPLRKASSSGEWDSARPVSVNLAGGRRVEMRMTPSNTLLLPVSESGSTTIVPVGELVQTLGYRLDWSRSKCRLVAPDGASMKLSMRDGCPQMPEFQALDLIARLEQKKLDQLRAATTETESTIRSAALSMDRSWFESLVGFCGGDRSAGLRAVDSAPFFRDVPSEALEGLVSSSDLGSGWTLLKKISCWNRQHRRRLLNSDSWIIHVFSGKGSNPAFKSLNVGNSVVIEIDILSSSFLNVENQALWDVLTWGSMSGKVAAVIGGPPCKTFSRLRHRQPGPPPVRTREFPFGWDGQPSSERQEMVRDTRLFCRMIWLHSMAVAVRVW